ncbi:hypothetical protein AB0M02_26670 [Actinoplanes sp. NPDC051861]|uniref:DUF7779 domain-containing protein n=1 Tax=Actinoplanes sp. NPDC051861 TaxID=3155170 RepID=UPI0034393317
MEDAVPISVNDADGVMIGSHNVQTNYYFSGELPDRVFRVPFPVDPEFVGRDAEMAALAETLTTGSRAVVNQTIAGLGGIGKTQLAAHLAHAVADRFRIVWWIEAEHRSTMETSLRELGRAIGLDKPSGAEALTRLSSPDGPADWLLIYDNVESPESLRGMLPTRGAGNVLITTRHQDWPAWASVTNLGPLSPEAAATLLSGHTGDQTAERIAKMFGCLPLALRQAAAQLRAGMSLERYEELLRSRFVDAVSSAAPLPDYSHSVADVILMARSAAEAVEGESGRLLLLLALLDADGVETSLLKHLPPGDPLSDPLVMARALAALKRYSLVTPARWSLAHAVHRVVQEVVRSAASEDDVATAARTAVLMLTGEVDSWAGHRYEHRVSRTAEHLKRLLDIAERHCERETAALLLSLAERGAALPAGDGSVAGAARQALRLAESGRSFTDDDVVAALLKVHQVEHRSWGSYPEGDLDTAPIRRALALQRAGEPGGSVAEAEMLMELASTLARSTVWWVEFGFPEDDLAEAAGLIELAIPMLGTDRLRIASARVLHAGVIGHLRRVDEALLEYRDAVASAEADGTLWERRSHVAYALLKFGRVTDARSFAEPWLMRDPDDSSEGLGGPTYTGDRVFTACLELQRDWPEYIRYVETGIDDWEGVLRHEIGDGAWIHGFYSLADLRTGHSRLEHREEVAKLDELLETARFAEATGRFPHRLTRRFVLWDYIRKLKNPANWKLATYAFRLYDAKTIAPRVRARVARAQRLAEEGKSPASLEYALLKEARALADVDWKAAVAAFERARSLRDGEPAGFGMSMLASSYLDMASPDRPQSLEFVRKAEDLLATQSFEQHSVERGCRDPRLLSRAATLRAEMTGDHLAATELELTAATMEEKVHGRLYPGVAEHLCNAARHAAKAKTAVTPAALLEEALEIATVCFGDHTPRWAEYAAELAHAISDTDPARAKSLLEHAFRIFTDYYGPDHSMTRAAGAGPRVS